MAKFRLNAGESNKTMTPSVRNGTILLLAVGNFDMLCMFAGGGGLLIQELPQSISDHSNLGYSNHLYLVLTVFTY